jgi:hypothetical protein
MLPNQAIASTPSALLAYQMVFAVAVFPSRLGHHSSSPAAELAKALLSDSLHGHDACGMLTMNLSVPYCSMHARVHA